MSFAQIQALRNMRAEVVARASEILRGGGDAFLSDLTEEQLTTVSGLQLEARGLQRRIEMLETQHDAENSLREGAGRRAATGLETTETRRLASGDPLERAEQEKRAWARWCRLGTYGLNDEERAILSGHAFEADAEEQREAARETRAQSAVTAAKGGYTVPDGPMQELEVALKTFGSMLEVAKVITTTHGRRIPLPTIDDTGNEGELVGESTEVGESELGYDQKHLDAYKVSSRLVRVPTELIEDSEYPIETHVAEALGERCGRTVQRYTTLGTGIGEPQGVVPGSTLGFTAANAATLVYGDFFGLFHSVDPSYRIGPKVGWMFNDNTLGKTKGVKDDANHLIFQRDLAGGTPATLDGKPYSVNQLMANVATTTKPILFGDFSKFVIRRVRAIRVLRLAERFAELDQVAFVAFLRIDSRLVDAGQHPIKHLQMA